jgi:large repetitive protein
MTRKIIKFLKKNFPVFMVGLLLVGFIPSAPARANENVNTEVPEQIKKETTQQLVGETLAETPLSWSALSLLDKNVMTTFYQTDKPNAKLSADERYVAINRHQLVSMDPPQIKEVITVYDRVTGETDNISVEDSSLMNGSTILDFDMSDDANYIVFSYSEGFFNEVMNVYLYDRTSKKLELITPVAGEDIYGDDANRVSISADGRYVAFDSDAKGLVPEDRDTFRDVFVYDRLATDTKIKRISTVAGLSEYEVGDSQAPSISGDGRYIAFQSRVNFTKDENESSTEDIYIYDKENTETPFKKVSVGLGGVDADGMSIHPSISADGQSVAFLSEAANLVEANDENYSADLFLFNGASIKRLAFLPEVTDPEDLYRFEIKKPTISPDGKFVGYELEENTDEETLTDAYVASVESETSTKVTVTNSPFQLENPSHSTVVGAGANTVVFYAMYERTFWEGTTLAIPGPFIAAQGSNPTWAPGSSLQVTEQPGGVTLNWPDARDAGEILGYQIYQNDTVIGYVPFDEENTFTATEPDPTSFYSYQVEAVNSQYNVSYGGPTYIKGSGTPVDPVVVLDWDADRSKNRLPMIGSTVTFNAYMKTGLQGEGTLSYKVSTSDGSTENRTQQLTFTEDSAQSGVYHTTFPITEGIVELTSFVVKVVDPATQEEAQQQLAGMPLKIAGNVTFDFENPGKADLNGAYLSIRSARLGGEFIVLKGNDPVTIEGLYPDEAYSATLYSSGGMRIYSHKDNIKVSSGGKENITLQVIAPANIRFKIVDTAGKAVENVGVQLFDSNGDYLGSYTSDETGNTNYFSHLTAGDQVTAKIDIGDYMFQKVPDQTIELLSGDQDKTITLIPLPVGVLEGTVTNSENEPVMNAIVTMQQTVDGKSIVRTTYSSLNGRYKFDNVFEGNVSVEAIETSNKYKTEESLTVKIEAEKTTNLPITVSQPKNGIINVKVYLKYIDGDWMGPVDMSQMPFFTRIEYQGGGWQTGYYQNAYYYGGYPNRTVKVCVTTTTPSFTSQCVDVTVDENGNATAELYFEEIGGRIQGSLALNDNFSVYGNLYNLSGISPSWEQHVSTNEFRSNDFNINIMQPGRYRLDLVHSIPTVQNRYEYASVEFTVEDQKITQLGTISFSPTSYFTNMQGNVFTAYPNRVFPGSTVDFRVSYKNVNKDSENASLIVSIPEGLVPIKDNSGRIIVSGIQEEATLEGKNLMIPLGDLAPNQSGTISYKLKANPDFDGFNVRTAARIQATIDGKTIDETLGTILLETPKVTVEVQDRLTSLENELTGYAPAGSMVSVYDGEQLIGSAQASATGFWKTNVVLPDLGDPSTHAIYAEATASSVKLRSVTVYPEYNTTSPKLLEMAMAQAPDGKWVYLQVEKGISRIPYTVRPNNPFQFELKFDRPDDVYNVYVYLGGQKGGAVKAVRDGNIYRAITPTSYDALGGIYVSYDSKPEPFTYNQEEQQTLEELRASLPPEMRDFEVVSTTPFELKNGKYSGEVKIRFPQVDEAMMTVTLSLEPNARYEATEEEVALAELTGIPIINSSVDEQETDNSITTVMEGYVPMGMAFPNGYPENQANNKLVSPLNSGGLSGYDAVAHVSSEVKLEFAGEIKVAKKIKSQFKSYKKYASRINRIMYNVERGMDCLAELPTTAREAGEALLAVVGGEIGKVALAAWTGAMGLTGPAGAAAGFASKVAVSKIDAYMDSKIDAIGSGYNECKEDDEKKKRRKVAEPKWIYDPSGFVYEAVPSNRLEGVKATVLYLDPETNTWIVWDAGPYEQINPQITNGEGKYGWDVPAGKWKVVWEKEGYETQTSAELDVPPPHTEVNAGLISRAAPQVEAVTGVHSATGSYVDVSFSKYLQVGDLANNALTVVGPDGKTIAGTAKFVGEVDNPTPTGPKLTRTVRFEVEGALDLSKEYQLKVNPSFFKSYADVWMKEAFSGSFTIVEKDIAGPIPVKATANGMMISIEFNELLSSIADGEKFLINGVEGLVTSAVTDVNNHKLLYLSLNQEIPAGQPIEITVLAGAISDEQGNVSVENKLSVDNQTASDNALLAGLVVDSATLSPVFDPNVFGYTVHVSKSATHLQMTANAADSNAKVFIDGMEVAPGVAKSVIIPANGVISITIIAEDGTTTRDYSIQVNRDLLTDVHGVLSQNGAPISGIIFSAHTVDGTNQWYDVQTDEKGEFHFALPDGSYQIDGIWIEAQKKWYRLDKMFTAKSGVMDPLVIELPERSVIQGSVEKENVAVPNVWVSIHTTGENIEWYDVRTDENGQFSIVLPDGDYQLDGVWVDVETKWYPLTKTFKVIDGQLVGATELNLLLKDVPTAPVYNTTGVVTKGTTPVSGVWVSVHTLGENEIWYDSFVDDNGSFGFNLPAGEYLIEGIWVDAEQKWYPLNKQFTVADEAVTLSIDLKDEIKGSLKKGTEALASTVFSFHSVGETEAWYDVTTDANGNFGIAELPDGDYVIEGVWLEAEKQWYKLKQTFTIVGGKLQNQTELVINLNTAPTPTESIVKGQVKKGDQGLSNLPFSFHSVGGAEIWYDVRTDAEGDFEIKLPDGEYVIEGIWVDEEHKWYELKRVFKVVDGVIDGGLTIQID